jgi:hypothetical protein
VTLALTARSIKVMTLSKHEMIINRSEYDDLVKAALWGEALDAAGVDNWQGHDEAVKIYQEMLKDNV